MTGVLKTDIISDMHIRRVAAADMHDESVFKSINTQKDRQTQLGSNKISLKRPHRTAATLPNNFFLCLSGGLLSKLG